MQAETKRRWLKAGTVAGALLIAAALVALLGAVAGIVAAFSTLRESGVGDPSTLYGAAVEVLASVWVGLVMMAFGLALLFRCMVVLRRHAPSASPPPL